ncbi:hypothetical protein [Pseudomonas farris]|nr:hypothetical protein [Pseudomonas farris]
MQTPPLVEYFQRVGIDRYPVWAPFVNDAQSAMKIADAAIAKVTD